MELKCCCHGKEKTFKDVNFYFHGNKRKKDKECGRRGSTGRKWLSRNFQPLCTVEIRKKIAVCSPSYDTKKMRETVITARTYVTNLYHLEIRIE